MAQENSTSKNEGDINQTESVTSSKEKIIVDAVELKTLEVRLNSVKEATQRSRFIFMMMTVICSAILLGIWNITFSWDKQRAFSPKLSQEDIKVSEKDIDEYLSRLTEERIIKLREKNNKPSATRLTYEEIKKQAADEITAETSREEIRDKLKFGKLRVLSNQDEVITEWIKNRVISIGLLGIRINVPDLSVIGSLSLVVITIWFFFCVRRENRAIVTLLRDVYEDWINKDVTLDVCRMVYYGIVNNLVFIDMRGGDREIGGLRRLERDIPSTRVKLLTLMIYRNMLNAAKKNISSAEENQEQEIETGKEQADEANIFFHLLLTVKRNTHKPFIRKIISVLAFLPPITIFLIAASDVISLLMRSPYRDVQKTLWTIITENQNWFDVITTIVIFDGIALVACVYTAVICWRCRKFSSKTAETIIEFRQKTRVE